MDTVDRPGLIVDLVKMITDINIDVESGEFDTEVYLTASSYLVPYQLTIVSVIVIL